MILVTYLAPSLPRELFEIVARHLADTIGIEVELVVDERTSGPRPGDDDPFRGGSADLGFMCAPAFAWLRASEPSPVVLIPVAPVFRDPRAAGRPVYFSDVIVRAARADRGTDLSSATWAVNDACSMSGYLTVLQRIGPSGHLLESGSHLRSIELVRSGEADAAAIDSNVLALQRRRNSSLEEELRIVDSWGPHPIQPVVARAELDARLKTAVTTALSRIHLAQPAGAALAELGLVRYAPVSDADYPADLGGPPGPIAARALRYARGPVAP